MINQYEAGLAIPDPQLLSKLERVLGVRLCVPVPPCPRAPTPFVRPLTPRTPACAQAAPREEEVAS